MKNSGYSRIDVAAVVCVLVLGFGLPAPSSADGIDELASAGVHVNMPGSTGQIEAFPLLDDVLVVGTSQNSSDPAGTLNDIFTVDPATNVSVSVATGVGVWGATADMANERILFTSSDGVNFGNELFEVPFAGGDPVSLGGITTVAGAPFRIDGLGFSGGVLYAATADGLNNGLYSIDMGTLVATNIALWGDSISGIDGDPDTGVIYGVNDTTGQLVTISTTGTIANVIAYPAGLTDIDGIAVGDGKAFLVTDEAGSIPVYDIASGLYETSLTSPFAAADTFSGAAYAGVAQQPTPTPASPGIPATNGFGLALLIGLIATVGLFVLLRR